MKQQRGTKQRLLSFFDPITRKRIEKFLQIKRSKYSLIIMTIAFVLSLFAELIANDKPLMVNHQGSLYFPVLKIYKGTDFGLNSALEPDYKRDQKYFRDNGWILEPLIWWGYNESNDKLAKYPAPPGKKNWLGTDDRGRDVFVRLLYGFRISMMFGLVTLFFALLLGTFIGGAQGFFGGKVDLIGQRMVEIWVSLPYLFVLILVVNIFEPSLLILVLILAAFTWINTSYYMRAECLRLKNQEFVMVAQSLGASKVQTFFTHVIPNAITPLVTVAPFVLSMSITVLAFLDYLGLGVQAPTASIGELLKQARNNFLFAWWLGLYPFITLVTTLLLINFVGEGVRKAFDPRANV